MKKIRFISLILVVLMMLSIVPITASATEEAAVTAPTLLPDGTTEVKIKTIVNYGKVGGPPTGWTNASYTKDLGYTMTKEGSMLSFTAKRGDAIMLKDAKGVLIEYDATAATADTWAAPIIRVWASAMNTNEQYWTTTDKNTDYYVFADGAWVTGSVEIGNNNGSWALLEQGTKGFLYVPMNEFVKNNTIDAGAGESASCIVDDVTSGKEKDYIIGDVGMNHWLSTGMIYKTFSVVYDKADYLEITGASVTLTNNFDVNFYADVPATATNVSMQIQHENATTTVEGVKLENGTQRFTYKNVLPQCMSETVTATLTATVNGVVKTSAVEYSIREYCENMLENENSSAALKTLLVDTLYYGAAAQTYLSYKTDDPATKNLTDEQKALRSADNAASITDTVKMTGTANADYKWQGAALRLGSTMAMNLTFAAKGVGGLTVEATINGRTVVLDDFTDNEDGTYTVIFNNIGAEEYASEMTAVMKYNGAQVGETLSYTVNAYVKSVEDDNTAAASLKSLTRAIYAYGAAAQAYVATLVA